MKQLAAHKVFMCTYLILSSSARFGDYSDSLHHFPAILGQAKRCWLALHEVNVELFMVALWNRADHYIFAMWFLLLPFFFFLA